MSDDVMNHGQNGHGVEFEKEDLSTKGVFAFMIGLAITGIIIYFIIIGMYSFLDRYEHSQMAPASPLTNKQDAGRIASRVPTKTDVESAFRENGAPMLEEDERGQLAPFLLNQEKALNSYGWVDEKAGVAHIPIERAMELTVQRGLPVRPQTGTTAQKDLSAATVNR